MPQQPNGPSPTPAQPAGITPDGSPSPSVASSLAQLAEDFHRTAGWNIAYRQAAADRATRITALTKELTKARAEIEGLRESFATERSQLADLTEQRASEATTAQAALEDLRASVAAERASHAALRAKELRAARSEMDDLRAVLAANRAAIAELQVATERLASDLAAANKRKSRLARDLADLRGKPAVKFALRLGRWQRRARRVISRG